jgi:hypothetical protein
MTCGHPVCAPHKWAFEVTAMPIIAAVEPAAHLRALYGRYSTVAAGSVALANEANLVYVSFTSVTAAQCRAIARRDVPEECTGITGYSVTYSIVITDALIPAPSISLM